LKSKRVLRSGESWLPHLQFCVACAVSSLLNGTNG